MTNSATSYFYTGRISLSLDVFEKTRYKKIFKDGYEGVFYSNPTPEYKNCVEQCSGLVKEITDEILDASGKKYEILWESNPSLSTDPEYISKSIGIQEWTPNEIVRFFIVNREDIAAKSEKIVAPMIISICGIETGMMKPVEFNGIIH